MVVGWVVWTVVRMVDVRAVKRDVRLVDGWVVSLVDVRVGLMADAMADLRVERMLQVLAGFNY